MNKALISLMITMIFFVGSCVGDTDSKKSGLGESCTKSSDCEGELKCIDLICVDGIESTADTEKNDTDVDSSDESSDDEVIPDPVCGDGKVSGGEICDGNSVSCTEAGLEKSTGIVECKSDCTGWVTYPDKCKRKGQQCSDLPVNAVWNTVSSVDQIWDGFEWQPSLKGSYSESESTTGCVYKCSDISVWTGSSCDLFAGGKHWSQKSKNIITWESSIKYCEELKESGFSNWRLPSISELRILLQNCSDTVTGGECEVMDSCLTVECENKPCEGCESFTDGRYSVFGDKVCLWSSSEVPIYDLYAWSINFGSGGIEHILKDQSYCYVRCVK
ncbi:MAG TPA: DUF1566 domain-containing protein [bacterium]|nr:DUF1566 domain-containing protein [bacterium]